MRLVVLLSSLFFIIARPYSFCHCEHHEVVRGNLRPLSLVIASLRRRRGNLSFAFPNTPRVPEIATSGQKPSLLAMTVGGMRWDFGTVIARPRRGRSNLSFAVPNGFVIASTMEWCVAISLLGSPICLGNGDYFVRTKNVLPRNDVRERITIGYQRLRHSCL